MLSLQRSRKSLRVCLLDIGANQTLSSSLVEGLRHLSAPDNNKAGPSNASEELLVARIWSRDCPNKRVALKKIISSVIACSETPGSGDVSVHDWTSRTVAFD